MSGKKASPPVSPSMEKWGTKTTKRFGYQTKTGVAPWTTMQFTTRTNLDKQRPVTGSARLEQFGWRDPTPFRAYVGTLTSHGAFEYEGTNLSGVKVAHKGAEGYNPPSSAVNLYLGMSGTGGFPLTNSNTKDRALTECLNKLKDLNVNVAEAIATLDQSIGMLGGAVLSLWYALKQAHAFLHGKGEFLALLRQALATKRRHVRLRILRKIPNHITSRWLELQYGWLPIMSDISSLLEAAKSKAKFGLGMRLSAVRNVQYDEPLPIQSPLSPGALMLIKGRITSGCKVRLDAKVTNLVAAQLDSIGLTNPALLMWELIPFSFVVDWILPVGNFLQALSATIGVEFLGGSSTSYTKTNVDIIWTQYAYQRGVPIGCSIKSVSTERSIYLSMPLPRLYMKSPLQNVTRVATALSLLNQLAK